MRETAEHVKRPNFFLVGTLKSASTSMHGYLRQHPEIFMPSIKSPNYFAKDLYFPGTYEDTCKYLSLFSEANTEKRIGEASETYLYSIDAPHLIKAECPCADRFIAILRNPVEMVYALHSQYLFSRWEEIVDFGEAIEAESARKSGHLIPKYGQAVEHLYYSEIAKYADQVERYVELFGSDCVHVVLFDDLLKDLPGIYTEILRFLGVDDQFRPNFKVSNPNIVARSWKLHRWVHAPNKLVSRMARLVLPTARLRMPVVKALDLLNLDCKPRPTLDPRLRRRLQCQFAPQVRQVGELIGRDLDHWLAP